MKSIALKIVALGLILAPAAYAGVADGAGKWAGHGSVFSLEGQEVSQYQFEVSNTPVDAHTLLSVVTVKLADGTSKEITQTLHDGDKGFRIESSLGNGGGYYFGEGMLEVYVGTPDGHGYASTIAVDSDSQHRVLRTELQNGKAIRFFREKMIKIQ